MGADKHCLERRHNTWHVVVEVPKALRARAGRKRFKKSLGTSSLAEANRHKLPIIDGFKRQIDALRRGDADAALFQDALEHRTALERAATYLPEETPDHISTDREQLLDLIRERANEIHDERGKDIADRYFDVATGDATFIEPLSVTWFAERQGSLRASVLGQQRADFKRYLAWAGQHATIEGTSAVKQATTSPSCARPHQPSRSARRAGRYRRFRPSGNG